MERDAYAVLDLEDDCTVLGFCHTADEAQAVIDELDIYAGYEPMPVDVLLMRGDVYCYACGKAIE